MPECNGIPKISLSQFRSNLFMLSKGERLPLFGMLELTKSCNFSCTHCYLPKDNGRAKDELNTDEIKGIIDQAAQAGCLYMLITGGEPLSHRDFKDIYSYSLKKGIFTSVFTNGSLIDRGMADFFYNNPPGLIEISLYGASEGTYRVITKKSGAFDKVLNGIHLLKERKINFNLKTLVTRFNYKEINEIEQLAKSLDVSWRIDTTVNASVDKRREVLESRISPEEAVEIRYSYLKNHPEVLEQFKRKKDYYKNSNKGTVLCGAGSTNFFVSSEGNLQICSMFGDKKYDLREKPLKEGFEKHFPQVQKTLAANLEGCISCKNILACSICPAIHRLESECGKEHFEYYCRMAKAADAALEKYSNNRLQPSHR